MRTVWLGLSLSSLLYVPRARGADTLEGRWATEFFDARLTTVRMEHEFARETTTFRLWVQSNLPYQTRGYKTERTGHYRIVGPSASVPGAFDVDVVIDSVTLTFVDPDSVILESGPRDELNCGFPEWRLNEPQDVTGRVCGGQTFAAAGTVERTTFKIDGDRLQWAPYWGPNALVPQAPNSAAPRTTAFDEHVLSRR